MSEKWYVIEHRDDAFFGQISGVVKTSLVAVVEDEEQAEFIARTSKVKKNTWYRVSAYLPQLYEKHFKYEDGRFITSIIE